MPSGNPVDGPAANHRGGFDLSYVSSRRSPALPWRRRVANAYPHLEHFTNKDGLISLITFLAADVAFVAAAIAIELRLGNALHGAHLPGTIFSANDAVWHLSTVLVLALAARRRVALWVAPVMSLGLDVDHVYGSFIGTVTGRSAHDVFFVALVALLLFAVRGRPAALMGVAAAMGHIAVDGATFPFFGPVTTNAWALPFPVEIALVGLAAVLLILAFHPVRAFRDHRIWIPLLVATTVVSFGIYFVLPTIPLISGV
jgi:hypothetical protein